MRIAEEGRAAARHATSSTNVLGRIDTGGRFILDANPLSGPGGVTRIDTKYSYKIIRGEKHAYETCHRAHPGRGERHAGGPILRVGAHQARGDRRRGRSGRRLGPDGP